MKKLFNLKNNFKSKCLLTPSVGILLMKINTLNFLSFIFFYLLFSVSHAYSWKLIKPHIFAIIQDVIFPIMSFSDADQELWETDPHGYIRIKFGKFCEQTHFTFILYSVS